MTPAPTSSAPNRHLPSPSDRSMPRSPSAAWWAIVLNWNGRDETLRCLQSLAARADAPPVGVVVVDNGSVDDSVTAIRAAHPDVELVENGANLGYAGGCNAGIRRALTRGAEWVVLVNNDARVAPDTITAFAAAAVEHPEAGALAGKVYFDDDSERIWYAGGSVRAWLGYHGRVRGYGKPDGPAYRRLEPTERATGALMAVSRTAIERCGLLDEELFAYVEDLDWSVRIRRAGFALLFVPDAVAWHLVSASTGGEMVSTHNLYYGARNTLVSAERERRLGPLGSAGRRAVILATFAAQALGRPGKQRALRAVLEGWRDGRGRRLGSRPGTPP
jgi:GT2 family glycosyltransferase